MNKNRKNFDDFENNESTYCSLQLLADKNENNWLECGKILCDYLRYSNSYTCKYSIYIAVKNKFIKISDKAKTLMLVKIELRPRP